ncbi:hypothetical protein GGI07_003367 [Coemansia sp. Benny D115]|nr:hypothetical protein GGI07_003367 [Coemansia sp. Benny D115]
MDFGARRLVLPECHAVPRTKFSLDEDILSNAKSSSKQHRIVNPVYKNVRKGYNHTLLLSELQDLCAVFYRPEVAHDKRLLFRIFYRNWNQHRNSVYFRRLYELRRALRVLDSVRLTELLKQLVGAFYSDPEASIKTVKRRVGKDASLWKALPYSLGKGAVATSEMAKMLTGPAELERLASGINSKGQGKAKARVLDFDISSIAECARRPVSAQHTKLVSGIEDGGTAVVPSSDAVSKSTAVDQASMDMDVVDVVDVVDTDGGVVGLGEKKKKKKKQSNSKSKPAKKSALDDFLDLYE